MTNGLISPFFSISRGSEQGHLLSPLLFIQVLDPLAIAIRSDTGIQGGRAGGEEHELFLHAEDILWLSVDPDSSAL